MMIWITLMEPLWFHSSFSNWSCFWGLDKCHLWQMFVEMENLKTHSHEHTHKKRINRATFLKNIGNVMWGLVIFSVIQLILIIFKYWKTGLKWCLEEKPQWIGAGREQINTRNLTILVAYLPELVFIWHLKKGRSKEQDWDT